MSAERVGLALVAPFYLAAWFVAGCLLGPIFAVYEAVDDLKREWRS